MLEIKTLEKSQIEITAEIPADDFERAYRHALQHFNNETSMPGFRKGHVPEDILVGRVGSEKILRHAAQDAIQSFYEKILFERKIEAIGRPEVAVIKLARKNPLGFVLKTAVLPNIALPDYKAIAKEAMQKKEDIRVEEKEIEETIEYLRNAKRTAHRAPQESVHEQERSHKSEEVDAEHALPELNDEFAQSVGPYNTLDELKTVIRTNLLYEKEMKAREKKRMEVLDAIAPRISVEVPDIMIEREKEKMAGELRASVQHTGLSWENYMSHIKKTEEELKNGWNEDAKKRVLYGLILRQIALQEGVSVEEKEIDEYVRMMKTRHPESEQGALHEENLRNYAYGIIKNEKTFQSLEAVK